MPSLSVQANVDISASLEDILQVLTNFNTWPAWSPWLYIEPDAALSYRGTAGQLGHGYDWVGDGAGSGGMALTKITGDRVECDLRFLKPFKSQADIAFKLEALDAKHTRVNWLMDSKLPFFMFWMKQSMSGMIHADYARGLALLKDYVEKEQIPSKTSDVTTVEMQEQLYVGVQDTGRMDDIAQLMGESFETVSQASNQGQCSFDGRPFCLYNTIDFKQQRIAYTAAMPCEEGAKVDAPLSVALRPACNALTLVHTGAYRHLGNAWSKLMAEAKQRKFKPMKDQAPFEVYLNDSSVVDESNLITLLYLPLKS